MAAANVRASAVNTAEWWSTSVTSLAVPVYQRHYRWDENRCSRLMADIRDIADAPAGSTHFVGSVLATADEANPTELTLIDGQQRLTTLTLIAAAVAKALGSGHASSRGDVRKLLVNPDTGGPKLIAHRGGTDDLARIVGGETLPEYEPGKSTLADNWALLRREVGRDVDRIWRGLCRLEHVIIVARPDANPQQIFESLNATGVALTDDELIHNYVLMGLPHDRQAQLEQSHWAFIEAHTGAHIESFWRDYLTWRTGRHHRTGADHDVYDAFRAEFPPGIAASIEQFADEWLLCARMYGMLLDPSNVTDEQLATTLRGIGTFGTAAFPVAMAVLVDAERGTIDRATALELLHGLTTVYLRRSIVGTGREQLAAQLCRLRTRSGRLGTDDLARRAPDDERIAAALAVRPLPHADYVLATLQHVTNLAGVEIEHIFPQEPPAPWSPDGERTWQQMDPPEQARYHELLGTIGNLTLFEQPLNAGASNKSFEDKKPFYSRSAIAPTAELASEPAWDAAAIEARAAVLTDRFLVTWPRADIGPGDMNDLVPILDAARKPGYYPGWRTEFDYVQFQGQRWEVHHTKDLFHRVFHLLWEKHRDELLDYAAEHGGPVYASREWNGRWEPLDESHYLFTGMFPQYCLAEVQAVLEHMNMAEDVLVKYNPDVDEE